MKIKKKKRIKEMVIANAHNEENGKTTRMVKTDYRNTFKMTIRKNIQDGYDEEKKREAQKELAATN